jgi:hypothetical protein
VRRSIAARSARAKREERVARATSATRDGARARRHGVEIVAPTSVSQRIIVDDSSRFTPRARVAGARRGRARSEIARSGARDASAGAGRAREGAGRANAIPRVEFLKHSSRGKRDAGRARGRSGGGIFRGTNEY